MKTGKKSLVTDDPRKSALTPSDEYDLANGNKTYQLQIFGGKHQ
jgi:hypothetical protein